MPGLNPTIKLCYLENGIKYNGVKLSSCKDILKVYFVYKNKHFIVVLVTFYFYS